MKGRRVLSLVLSLSTMIGIFPKTEIFAEGEYQLTVVDGQATDSENNAIENGSAVVENTELSLSFVKPSDDAKFVQWVSDTVSFDDPSSESTSFIMPSADTNITAEYVLPYEISTNDDQIIVKEDTEIVDKAYSGDVVTVIFESAKEGTVFNGWEAEGITFADPSAEETTFVMPENEVALSVSYNEAYTISYDNNIISITTPSGNDRVFAGDSITVKYNPKDEQHDEFESWLSDQVTFANSSDQETTFIMPEEDVTISAQYNTLYSIKVTNGTSSVEKAKKGDQVTVTAKGSSTEMFNGWTIPSSITGADKTKESIQFKMIDSDVELVANFVETKNLTGWETVLGKKYYFVKGNLTKGWKQINKSWYYFDSKGVMQTGFQKIKNSKGTVKTYYFNSEGKMLTGWQKINKVWYYFNDSGAMVKGWMKLGNTWYYMKDNGAMATGWLKLKNTWYYFRSGGAMAVGWQKVGNTWYFLKDSGAMATGWLKLNNIWYYMKGSGAMAVGWQKVGNTWYYFKSSGAMATGWQKVDNKWYFLKDSGAMATGWLKRGNTWYYLKPSGAMTVGWLKIDNVWYYFKESGAMVKNGTYAINGKSYYFNALGHWIDESWLNSRSTPYYIKVNRATNTITVYGQDYNNNWTIPIRSMYCSVGMDESPTPVGEYSIGTKRSWWKFNTVGYGRYVSGFCADAYKFHSVGYWVEGDPSTLDKYAFNALGHSGSHGCVRLAAIDAWWIWAKCPIGTTVRVYEDEGNPGPLGWPEKHWIDTNDWRSGWDPTDPDPNNPW